MLPMKESGTVSVQAFHHALPGFSQFPNGA
jgi:hypothetical protein